MGEGTCFRPGDTIIPGVNPGIIALEVTPTSREPVNYGNTTVLSCQEVRWCSVTGKALHGTALLKGQDEGRIHHHWGTTTTQFNRVISIYIKTIGR